MGQITSRFVLTTALLEKLPKLRRGKDYARTRFHRRPKRPDCFGLSLFRRATLNWTSDYGKWKTTAYDLLILPVMQCPLRGDAKVVPSVRP
jgi:hypothetical protein